MKTMKKGLGMNKMLGGLKRRTTGSSSAENMPPPANQSPEEAAATAVKQFCSSDNKTGDEVLFLPTIVDAAESSPAAAAECARLIRKYLTRSYNLKPTYQYNAVMLVRILTDNPGPTFTRNLDKKFAETVKDLLKTGKDRSMLNLLMETLDTFEYTKVGDEGLTPLIEMWKKEKEKGFKNEFTGVQPAPQQTWRPSNNHDTHYSNSSSRRPAGLPSPEELASRLEEASTSAKLLTQFVTTSTAQELLESDLVREFASRCKSASKSIQAYMVSENPGPDNDTMESLLDANEQLQAALNAHQRAALSAKKSLGITGGTGTPPVGGQEDPAVSVSGALGDSNGGAPSQAGSSRSTSVTRPRNNGKGREEAPGGKGKGAAGYEPPPGPPPGWNIHPEDPFRDPNEEANNQHQHQQGGSSYLGSEALVFDSFHPGFTNAGPAAGGSGSGFGSGYGAGKRPEDDDDIYDSAPRR